MTLTPTELGQIITVLVVIGTALAGYLDRLSMAEAARETQRQVSASNIQIGGKVDAATTQINGQAHALNQVVTTLNAQASYAAGQQSVLPPPAVTIAPVPVTIVPPPPNGNPS